ncbi:hypothetical protein FUAX_09720 [Fulvitalea axinellae]|uniref:Uncharacterized protein n=1 Tax=Fulvitalea axinellae TaxID=1182444 RepID=A0AAU9CH28_9BACT|nr:hypothetical protein FUAX_09720 [Fulvitalea axinellae]
MGYLADVYVIQKSRSKKLGVDFLNHFLPIREESADEYLIPQYLDDPIHEFDNAEDLMTFLESNPQYAQSIYWRNKDKENLNKQGMIFYTKDGNMILGISRNADMSGNLNTENEDECLIEMKKYFKTENGYIHYENPPAKSYDEFIEIVNKLKR